MRTLSYFSLLIIFLFGVGCTGENPSNQKREEKARLTVINPQHFHAALVQKHMHPAIDSVVHLFADSSTTVKGYKQLIAQYNMREDDPTHWRIIDYYGANFLEKAFDPVTGNVVILAGDNQRKIDYIQESVRRGRDVFADKPLVIDVAGYRKLNALMKNDGGKESVLVYDMMTERYDVKNQVVKSLLNNQAFSGGLVNAKDGEPAILFQSVHHFIKDVSGKPLLRPALFFDTEKQGEGLVDVTTHYIDLVQWMLSSETVIDIDQDVKLTGSQRWKTSLSNEQFQSATGLPGFPSVLQKHVVGNDYVDVFCNGKMEYTFKGIPVSIDVRWHAESLDGRGDQFYARFLGNSFTIEIKPDESGKAAVFITPNDDADGFENQLVDALDAIKGLPGITAERVANAFKIVIPEKLYLSHEDHFAKVLDGFLRYRKDGVLPAWEKSFILAKYYLTTKALEEATTIAPPFGQE
ncbi:putative oxidoreductase C-terminal domain-containing protein [Sphingobacterium haloxyli]|nr:putative oxidoreductase C-terminal domain-containing protein [Sphingobacterium haloxyli]